MKITITPLVRTAFLFSVLALVVAPSICSADSGSREFDTAMQPILEHYLKIHGSLAGDSMDEVEAQAAAIAVSAKRLDAGRVTGPHAEHYSNLPASIEKSASELSKAAELEAAREAMMRLSRPLAMWATMSSPDGVDVVFCSMAKASWLQRGGEVRNPYYGASMLKCGEVVAGANHDEKGAAKHSGHDGHHHGD